MPYLFVKEAAFYKTFVTPELSLHLNNRRNVSSNVKEHLVPFMSSVTSVITVPEK
jgi:hypothetical protein